MITLGETSTTYCGERHRVAVLQTGEEAVTLTLGDTRRCAISVEEAERTLSGLFDASETELRKAAGMLNVHCRTLTRWKEQVRRDPPRQRNSRREGWTRR